MGNETIVGKHPDFYNLPCIVPILVNNLMPPDEATFDLLF